MSEDVLGRLAALPPIKLGEVVIDVGSLFRGEVVPDLEVWAGVCGVRADGLADMPLDLLAVVAFGVALERKRMALGLAQAQVYLLVGGFAMMLDAVLAGRPVVGFTRMPAGVASIAVPPVEQQIGGVQ
jgi:hypothetical protein